MFFFLTQTFDQFFVSSIHQYHLMYPSSCNTYNSTVLPNRSCFKCKYSQECGQK